MVLYSQAPRPGAGNKYMVSSRRRPKRWRIAVLLLVVCVGAGLYLMLRGGDSESTTTGATSAPVVVNTRAPVTLQRPPASTTPTTSQPTTVRQAAQYQSSEPTARVQPQTPTLEINHTTSAPDTPRPVTDQQAAATAQLDELPSEPGSDLSRGKALIAAQKFVEGRRVLSKLLLDEQHRLTPADAQTIRDTLTNVNKILIFSHRVMPGDNLVESYLVKSGDYLSRIAPRYKIPYQLIERINNVQARKLPAGKRIKVIKGPFHARVIKHDFRMDLLLSDTDGTPIYVCSFSVGLGEFNSTPQGAWAVGKGRKNVNPGWRNPRNNQYFAPNDPNNPIGEYWIGLVGIDEQTKNLSGYGIHGTIEPGSIGKQESMGCIRLRSEDIKLVFDLLSDGHSTVTIVP